MLLDTASDMLVVMKCIVMMRRCHRVQSMTMHFAFFSIAVDLQRCALLSSFRFILCLWPARGIDSSMINHSDGTLRLQTFLSVIVVRVFWREWARGSLDEEESNLGVQEGQHSGHHQWPLLNASMTSNRTSDLEIQDVYLATELTCLLTMLTVSYASLRGVRWFTDRKNS
jgi:hypothetical protein